MHTVTSPRRIVLCALALIAGILACNIPGVSTVTAPTLTPVVISPAPPTEILPLPAETIPPLDMITEPTLPVELVDGIHPMMLGNATYVIEGTAYNVEGWVYDDESIPVHIGVSQTAALGDINGDGVMDIVTTVSQNTGGSGTFIFLAAMINEGGSLTNVASIGLGDRVIVHNIELADGLIGVDFTTQDADDPFCCPTLDVYQTLQLQNGALVVLDEQPIGGGFASYQLYDMTYTLEGTSFPLTGGVYQNTANNITATLRGPKDLNDLNGDGAQDAAVILVLDGGGTGRFVNLAAVVDQGGTPVHVATVPLGDREIIHNLWIDQFGTIHVEGTFHDDDDPGCCASEYRVLKYTLLDDQLVYVP